MQCESHFKSSFGNVNAFNFKKLKLSLSPSPPQWPQAALPGCGWGATAGKFLRQSLGRTVFGLESFESIPETSKSSVETCTWAILRGTMQFGDQLLLNCPSGRQVSSSHELVDPVVYLHAKFGELNLRIDETRSSENRSGRLPQVQ